PLLARIRDWLRPGGTLLASFGVEDDPGTIEEDWLRGRHVFQPFQRQEEPPPRRGGGSRRRLGRGPRRARGSLRRALPVGRGPPAVSDRRSLRGGPAVITVGMTSGPGGTLIGSAGDASSGIGSWPPLVRAALVGAFVAIGLA